MSFEKYLILLIFLFMSPYGSKARASSAPPVAPGDEILLKLIKVCAPPIPLKINVIEKLTRRERRFTQGLELFEGFLYESTGSYLKPTYLTRIDLSGQDTILSSEPQQGTFGEGLTIFRHQIYQATWKDEKMFVFDKNGNLLKTMDLIYEGWGLTNNGEHLILSDGTPLLRFLNPDDLSLVKKIEILIGASPVNYINELEWVNGKIYGNVYQTDQIVRIDPDSGCVDGIVDANSLYESLDDAEKEYLNSDINFVLNGIAYDSLNKLFYLTGKNWKYIFKVSIQE